MGIGIYIKEIGRGKEGARSLTRLQAADLLGQVLDGAVSDLEVWLLSGDAHQGRDA